MSNLIRNEQAHSINGVPGRLLPLHVPPAPWVTGVFANQTWISETRPIEGYGSNGQMNVNIRFDDNCKNGSMTFAITADVYTTESRRRKDVAACGCLHDDIAKVFPELAPLIKWHLVSTDGPMHYLANTIYQAGNRDSSRRSKGEPSSFEYGYKFGNSPVTHRVDDSFFKWIEARRAFNSSTPKSNPAHGEFKVCAIAYEGASDYKFSPKFTLVGFGEKWYDCPFDDETSAQEIALALNTSTVTPVRTATAFSGGKARELDHARNSAVWPDATDEQLIVAPDELKAALEARLPALLADFRADMERIGFLWIAPAA